MTIDTPEVILEPDQRAVGDRTQFWRVPRYRGLECLRATFRRHAYVRHTHETYAIATILSGCETFFHRGAQHYASAGAVAVIGPGELHDGEPYGGGFEYRTLYPSVALMQEIAEDIAGRPLPRPPYFPKTVMADPELVGLMTRAHAALRPDDRTTSLLERDACLVAFLAQLIARHASLEAPPVGRESRAVGEARAYLDTHFGEDVELETLTNVAGLSRTQLIRAFRREVGLTPHAYLLDRRFRAASRLLERGEPPTEVAAACGFYDQSHLNRVFKARMGVTPGVYRAA